jgi:hypothetical protein
LGAASFLDLAAHAEPSARELTRQCALGLAPAMPPLAGDDHSTGESKRPVAQILSPHYTLLSHDRSRCMNRTETEEPAERAMPRLGWLFSPTTELRSVAEFSLLTPHFLLLISS